MDIIPFDAEFHESTNSSTADDEWKALAERVAAELEHDSKEVDAGRMTVEEFDEKW
jgi:hypothetical protein